ncbi:MULTISPECIES: plastocyanin/azurin family copper-binding protein [Rhodobacterales]|nr:MULTISPECIES: plastocyanin/azurin family copper-binding protein [Rhodobacterales]
MTFMKSIGATTALILFAGSAMAGAGHGSSIGKAGDPDKVDRVIEVSMDEMKYEPKSVSVAKGETIKFVVRNDGNIIHEFNLGTEAMWKDHKDEMKDMMKSGMMTMKKLDHAKMMEGGMMHNDPNSVLLEPGQTAEVVWTFTDTTEMGFACNVPGHLEGGMVGKIAFSGH